jgi:acyl carrier protein
MQPAQAVIADELCGILRRLVPRLSKVPIDGATSVVDDLALGSLNLVELTVVLEELLGVPEFPMQRWLDLEKVKSGPRFTVASLAAACVASAAEGARRDEPR